MGKIAVALACLGYGSLRWQVLSDSVPSTDKQASARYAVDPMKAFALLSVSLHAAYNPCSTIVRPPMQTPASRLTSRRHRAPELCIGDMQRQLDEASVAGHRNWKQRLTRGRFVQGIVTGLAVSQIWPQSADADEVKPLTNLPLLAGKTYGKSEIMSTSSDFTRTSTGLYYKDNKAGAGESPQMGDRVVLDWSGYTIGFRGQPFETRQLRKLDKIEDALMRFVVGKGTVISGIEQGVQGMQAGGIRQVVVPFGPLSYPQSDMQHEKVGPKPSTFSGYQALNFVLMDNGMIDKTLLFNIKLLRVDKPDGKGGFISGKMYT